MHSIVIYASNRFRFFFFNDTATTEIYTLSLHDAFRSRCSSRASPLVSAGPSGRHASGLRRPGSPTREDRKSTRLNSSHVEISYAVFCLKKKKSTSSAKSKRQHAK